MKLKLQWATAAAVLACTCGGVSIAQTSPGRGGGMTRYPPSTSPAQPIERGTPGGPGAANTAPGAAVDGQPGSPAGAIQSCEHWKGALERHECIRKGGDGMPSSGATNQAPGMRRPTPNPGGTTGGTASPPPAPPQSAPPQPAPPQSAPPQPVRSRTASPHRRSNEAYRVVWELSYGAGHGPCRFQGPPERGSLSRGSS